MPTFYIPRLVGGMLPTALAQGAITGPAGVWTNVTPAGVDITVGPNAVVTDPTLQGRMFAQFAGSLAANGIYQSLDYGLTWTQINATMTGQISIAPNGTLYQGGIAGGGLGFFVSTDHGVTWTNHSVTPFATQDVYPPSVDPNDSNHLIITRHEANGLAESTDGGSTWSGITLDAGMTGATGTAFAFFINTGTPSTTRTTWIWTAQGTGGAFGTWRTTNSGSTWTHVDAAEHPHGAMQIYQPDTSGVGYLGEIYSGLGQGVLRTTDYFATFTHVGDAGLSQSGVVSGTPNNIYSFYGIGGSGPAYQTAAQPGITGWTAPTVPMSVGAAMLATITDGRRWAVLGACWNAGMWRLIE